MVDSSPGLVNTPARGHMAAMFVYFTANLSISVFGRGLCFNCSLCVAGEHCGPLSVFLGEKDGGRTHGGRNCSLVMVWFAPVAN